MVPKTSELATSSWKVAKIFHKVEHRHV